MTSENHLSKESSPYLRQHAKNPVNWYPWGDEAIRRAKRENKPIFLSIGYSSCHWCHVMEEESFSEQAIGDLLNRHFISIKVDREERPDLDGWFMDVAVAMNGQGGWPLNLFLTPDLLPLYAGTYFPPEARHGLPSFSELLVTIARLWREDPDRLVLAASRIDGQIRQMAVSPTPGKAQAQADSPERQALRFWLAQADRTHGGFGNGNKFPQPPILSFLLRQTDGEGLDHLLLTLEKMAVGGIRDHLTGAFHRYAVDRLWQVPHFEIMLADNALLAPLYLAAFQKTGNPLFAHVARGILDDLEGRFLLADGCFATALDADSQGEEGLYYTWTEGEIVAVLGEEEGKRFIEHYLDPFEGQVDGRGVLRFLPAPGEWAASETALAQARGKLLAARAARLAPARDDKVLTSLNALAITAFAKGAQVLGEARYGQRAAACMNTLLAGIDQVGEPRHSRLGEDVGREVFLDDYAFLIQALIDLFETDFNTAWLARAADLQDQLLRRFQPGRGLLFTFRPLDRPGDLPNQTLTDDGVMPSGNAIAVTALKRLAMLSGNGRWKAEIAAIMDNYGAFFEKQAPSIVELLGARRFDGMGMREVVVVGNFLDPRTHALIGEVRKRFIPGLVVVATDPSVPAPLDWLLLQPRSLFEERPTAYVCQYSQCETPVNELDDLNRLLDRPPPDPEPEEPSI